MKNVSFVPYSSHDKDKDKFGFTSDQMKALIDLVKEKLGAALFINQTGHRLADIPLSVITHAGSRVFAVFDNAGSAVDPAAGIYSYADYSPGSPLNANLVVYDEYSRTNDLKEMTTNQWAEQGDVANHGGDLFLLSWTLPQSDTQAAVCGITWLDSIVAIADQADAALYQQCIDKVEAGKITMPTIPNILYVDLADGFATDVAIYLNQHLAAES